MLYFKQCIDGCFFNDCFLDGCFLMAASWIAASWMTASWMVASWMVASFLHGWFLMTTYCLNKSKENSSYFADFKQVKKLTLQQNSLRRNWMPEQLSRLLIHVTGTPPWLLKLVKVSTISEHYPDCFRVPTFLNCSDIQFFDSPPFS